MHTHAFKWSEHRQMYICGCGEAHYSEALNIVREAHHIIYVFRGSECLMVDPIPYSTLSEAKDHAAILRGEDHDTKDLCFIFECNIDEQGDTFTVHHPRYRATI